MATVVIQVDTPSIGIEVTGEGSAPTDDQMKEEQEARQAFLDFVSEKLASLPNQPPRRAGNVQRVELLGADTWSQLNHYLLLVSVDIGEPALDWDSLLPPGTEASVIGSYAPLEQWPDDATADN
jgi:hypothetical protein